MLALAGGAFRTAGAQAPHARPAGPDLTPPPRVAGGADGPQEVRGRVLRPGPDSLVAYAGVRVTLHRVGPDRAAPMDSVLSDAAGRYRFTYRRSGDTTALYFVSASRAGIAYFTPPLRTARVEGQAAEIVLFDTTSAAVPIRVRGRHVVVAAPDSDGTRLVVEVFEVSNDSSVTRIAGHDGATFETPVPPGITDFAAGDGEVTASAMSLVRGQVRIVAPMMPGVKQFSFNYRLPAATASLAVPVPVPTSVLEVLLEEPAATASGAGLKAVATATSSGRTFRRYLAQDIPAGKQVAITVPGRESASGKLRLALAVTAVGAVMLIGFARAFRRRGPGVAPAAGTGDDAEAAVAALERELVELDDTFARKSNPTAEERGAHVAARARTKARLAAAIAARDGIG